MSAKTRVVVARVADPEIARSVRVCAAVTGESVMSFTTRALLAEVKRVKLNAVHRLATKDSNAEPREKAP
jgi:hypothetical protein